jgi:hypothetical protein
LQAQHSWPSHGHQEFLKTIDRNVLSALDVHLTCDNYQTRAFTCI